MKSFVVFSPNPIPEPPKGGGKAVKKSKTKKKK